MIAWLLAAGLASGAAPVTVWETDLQTSDGNLEPSGDPNQWAWGEVVSGPGQGYDGPYAWATRLSQVHMNNADDRLTLPQVDLTGRAQPVLVLTHWFDLEPGDADYATVEVEQESSWTTAASVAGATRFEGRSDGWQTDYFSLAAAGIDDLSSVRLRFVADDSVARDGWVVGSVALVDGDPIPPEVQLLTIPTDTQDLPGPHLVELLATDNIGVEDVRLVWFAGGTARTEVTMEEVSPDVFSGGLSGAEPGTAYVWWVEARDAAGNVEIGTGPTFRVYLPAPRNLTGPEGRIVDASVPLSWSPPDTPWEIQSYTVYRNGESVATCFTTSVDAPVSGANDVFTVSARFDTDYGLFEGDASNAVAVEAYPPAILRVSPASAWPGDTLQLAIQGRYLLLEAGDAAVDVGSGIDVLEVNVTDVDTMEVRLQVDADASPGTRTLAIYTNDRWVSADGAFQVRTGATRPRIEETAPTFLLRGQRQVIGIRTNVVLPDDLRLDLGTGVVVELSRRLNDFSAEFLVTVARDAPLEARTPELDVGTRLLAGPPVHIRPPQPTTQTHCGALQSDGASGAWVLVLLAGLWRRRPRAA